jgi:hypothetical protein
MGPGTAVACRADRVETGAPHLPFLRAAGELCAPRSFAHGVQVPGPDLLRQEPQGDALRWDGQRRLD